jgi:diguanylate cyclase (GGDEF)-like protein
MSQLAKTFDSCRSSKPPKGQPGDTTPVAGPLPLSAAELRAELAAMELLHGMGPELLDAVVTRCPLRVVKAGSTLLAAGQNNTDLYLVVRGELHVFLGDQRSAPVATLRPGDTVGELSAIDKKPTSAHVIAESDAQVLSVDENMLWHIIHASHGFTVRLVLKLAERLRANNATVQVNRELCARFEQVALSDALTGVHSRRWLEDMLPRLLDRHRFDKQPLSVALVDVDHFKRINDEHGHQSGDLVLCEIANTMRQRLRPTDFIARYGGEEFVLIFPRTTVDGARVAAERQREAVQATVLTRRDGTQLPPATISIGLSELVPGDDVARLLQIADEALYRAKRNGRNRVES